MKAVFRKGTSVLLILAMCVGLMLLSGCSKSGAEKQVEADLESMRNLELDEELSSELESILSDDGKEHFGNFKKLANAYEYEVIESKKVEGEDETAIIVTVRIRTYSFGREYLKTWTEYLEKKGEAEFDQAEFYEMLMKNLGRLESKGYYSDVDVVCIDPKGDGNWITNAASNADLRNAMLGGMPAEIAKLAQD